MRFLLLADDALDAERIQQVLRQSQQNPELIWAKTGAEFRDACSAAIDLILADYRLPDFNGPQALAWVTHHYPDIPFVVVANSLDEDLAIELLSQGATDYVLTQRLERLVPVMQRALRQADERRQRQRVERLLVEQQQLLELVATGHPLDDCLAAVCGAVARLSPSTRACFLLCDDQRQSFPRSITPDLPPSFGAGLKDAPINDLCIGTCGEAVYRGEPITCADIAHDHRWSAEWRQLCLAHGILACHSRPVIGVEGLPLGSLMLRFDAARLPSEWEYQLADFGTQIACIAFERDRSIQALQQSESRWQQLADASPSVIYTVVEDGTGQVCFEYLNPAFEAIHEVPVAVALQNAQIVFDQMHPDDREAYRRAVEHSIATLQPFQHEWRILTPSGRLKWLQANSLPQRRGDRTVWHGIVQEITERKQAEEQLRQREAELKEAQRLGRFGSWQWDAETDVTTGSDELLRIYGFDPACDTMPNFNDQDGWLYPHESWQRIHAGVQRALETGIGYELDLQAFRHGTPIWITTRSEVVRNADGTIVGLRGTVQDITERKQAELDLAESEERFRTLANHISQFAWMANADGWIFWYNQRWFDYTGTTLEQMQGWGWQQVHHPDHVERVVERIRRCFETGEPWEDTFPLRRHDGEYRWFLSRAIPIRDETGTILRWLGTNTDVTELRHAQEDLRLNQERLDFVLRATGIGLWLNPLPLGKLNWDARTRQLFFVPPDVEPRAELFWSRLHPDDREPTRLAVEQALQQGTLYAIDHRAIDPATGEIRWIRSAGQATYAPDGTPIRFDGINYDITDRKRAEVALQDSERRFRRLVESNLFGVAFGDFSGGIRYANQYFLNLIGYTREDIETGQVRWTQITPAEFLSLDYMAASELRAYGVAAPFEKEFIRKDGTRVPILIGSALLQEPYDQSQEIVAFFLDLSERKQSEAAIQQAYAELALQSSQLESVNQELEQILEELRVNEEELRNQNDALVAARQFTEIERQRYQDLFNFAPDGYVVTDPYGVIQEANRASVALLGYDATVQTSTSLAVYVAESDRRTFRNLMIELCTHSQPQTCELTLQAFGGSSFPAKITAVAIRAAQGQVLGIRWLIRDISERKQAEAALAANEARLRGFVEANVVGILYGDIYGNIHQANDELLRIVGYTREDLRAGRLRWLDITPPEWLPLDEERIAEARARGACTPYEKEYIRKDGSRVPVLVGYSLVGDAREESVAFILDLTDRKRAEAALRENEDRLQLALESAELGTWDYNPVTGVLKWDDQCKAMFGLPPEAEVDYDLFLAGLHPDDREPAHQATLRALNLESGGEVEIEYRTIGITDGIERWILTKGKAYFNAAGIAVRFIGTVLNITEKKRAEAVRLRLAAEREQLLARERAARAEAERANRIKDEFLAIVSHELRTPLNPILGWSTLLQTRKLDEAKTAQALSTIARNAKLQADLINDLLDVSRILRGKLSLNISPVNLVPTIEAAIETVRLAAEAKSIAIHAILDPQVSSVSGDSARLQQVVWNLLSNAVKFTPAGGRVEVRLEEVGRGDSGIENRDGSPLPPPSPSYAQLTITDTGKGIDPAFLPYVFDYFRQEDGATTRQFGGLGLGLAIVRQIVELHGGRVWAESRGENQGATFKVQLPLIASQAQDRAQTPETHPVSAAAFGEPMLPRSAAPLTSLCILVVDDDADTRSFVAFLLEQAGATVVTAASAREALIALSRHQPDVLLSDIGMPDIDGYMLMRQIRALPPEQGGTIPAIALTAYAGEIDYRQAMAAGFQQHLAKPIEPQVLIQSIMMLCSAKGNTTL